jgi:chemotaxis protein histidine kinase CheA
MSATGCFGQPSINLFSMNVDSELLESFADEAQEILESIEEPLGELESGQGNALLFTDIAQRIDRIMGCARSLGVMGSRDLEPVFRMIGELSEGSKFLGYRAERLKNPDLMRMVGGVIAEASELIGGSLRALKKGYVLYDAAAAQRSKERIRLVASKIQLSPAEKEELFKKFGVTDKDV